MKRTQITVLLIVFCLSSGRAQTLEECQMAAERNYPLISQYGLIEKTTELTVKNIGKGWLPQVSASVQATLQSDVTAWPDQMHTILSGLGGDMEGLKKDQYRIGLDVHQTLYDGGVIRRQKEIVRRQGEVQVAQTDVELYQIRRRVNEMYFGLLLIDEQLKLNADLQTLLAGNERKLQTMYEKGTAAESDYLNVKAERVSAAQQRTALEAQRTALIRMLEAFCGIEVTTAVTPSLPPSIEGWGGHERPELKVIDAQLKLADAQEKALDAMLMPKLGVFAQGWYGYPGLNMFEDMMHRQFSLNGMIGARLTWDIGALYTRKNDKTKLNVQREVFNVQRETFLFNNSLEQILQKENIGRYKKLMSDDDELISLRSAIRRAAESKLAHGIIDVNDLVSEINAENKARLQRTMHEIEMLKEIYDLRYTTNN